MLQINGVDVWSGDIVHLINSRLLVESFHTVYNGIFARGYRVMYSLNDKHHAVEVAITDVRVKNIGSIDWTPIYRPTCFSISPEFFTDDSLGKNVRNNKTFMKAGL